MYGLNWLRKTLVRRETLPQGLNRLRKKCGVEAKVSLSGLSRAHFKAFAYGLKPIPFRKPEFFPQPVKPDVFSII
jgi:hypothetical protein